MSSLFLLRCFPKAQGVYVASGIWASLVIQHLQAPTFDKPSAGDFTAYNIRRWLTDTTVNRLGEAKVRFNKCYRSTHVELVSRFEPLSVFPHPHGDYCAPVPVTLPLSCSQARRCTIPLS